MVQDRLVATEGEPFLHGFVTPIRLADDHVIDMTPSHLDIQMTLETDEVSYVFVHGRGFTEGRDAAGNLVAVFALHDPEELGLGEYAFSLRVVEDDNAVYEETGILEVVAAAPGAKPTPGVLLWFDALHPSDPDADIEHLPAAEIPQTIQDLRLRICGECPAFQRDSGECAECGCWMPYKSGLATAECPLGKWTAWGLNVIPS
jgi:hypothetical protein